MSSDRCRIRSASEGAPGRVTGTSLHAALSGPRNDSSGRRGCQAARIRRNWRFPAWMTPLHGGRVDVVGGDRAAVGLDPALVDHSAPVARRLAERLREERREVTTDSPCSDLRHLLRRLALADNAREVSSAPARPLPRPGATMKRASSSFASKGSPAGRSRSITRRYHCWSSASGMRIVFPNCSSGGSSEADVVPARGAHLGAVPAVQVLDRERDLRLEPVGLHHVAAQRAGCRADRCRRARRRPRPRRSRRPASAGTGARRPRSARSRRSASRSRRARAFARPSSSASGAGPLRSRACRAIRC